MTVFFRNTAGFLAKTCCFIPENDSRIWQSWGERLLPERQHELEKKAAGILRRGTQGHTGYRPGPWRAGDFPEGAAGATPCSGTVGGIISPGLPLRRGPEKSYE
jgi:hypothetical protein